MKQLRLLQERGAAAMPVDDAGRAAKVQIDPGGLQLGQPRGVVGQAGRVRAQQLRAHWHACRRAAAMTQLGHHAHEGTRWQQGVRHADELGHATVDAAHAGEDIAQGEIQQSLHGGQQDGHVK